MDHRMHEWNCSSEALDRDPPPPFFPRARRSPEPTRAVPIMETLGPLSHALWPQPMWQNTRRDERSPYFRMVFANEDTTVTHAGEWHGGGARSTFKMAAVELPASLLAAPRSRKSRVTFSMVATRQMSVCPMQVRSERVVHHKALFSHLCRRRGSAPCEVDGIAAGKVEDVEEMEAALPAAHVRKHG